MLFLGSAGGVAALLELVFGSNTTLNTNLDLSASLLFGFATGLALLSSNQVRWACRWQRYTLRFTYPFLILACGLLLDDLRLPIGSALMFGVVAATCLAALLARVQRLSDATECSHA